MFLMTALFRLIARCLISSRERRDSTPVLSALQVGPASRQRNPVLASIRFCVPRLLQIPRFLRRDVSYLRTSESLKHGQGWGAGLGNCHGRHIAGQLVNDTLQVGLYERIFEIAVGRSVVAMLANGNVDRHIPKERHLDRKSTRLNSSHT